jgi:hypothetical protein
MNIYRLGVEHDFQRQAGYKLAYPGLNPADGVLQVRLHNFVEFTTGDPPAEFAEAPDTEALAYVVERQKDPAGLTLLKFEDAANW